MVIPREGLPYGFLFLLFIIHYYLFFLSFLLYCYILCILICRRQSCSCQQRRNSKWILRYIIDGMRCNDFLGTCWKRLNGCHRQSTKLYRLLLSADFNILFKFTRFSALQIGPRKLDFLLCISTPLCVTHFYTFQTRTYKFYDGISYAIFWSVHLFCPAQPFTPSFCGTLLETNCKKKILTHQVTLQKQVSDRILK